ncbi:YheC/YheD family protein [Neobacillus sp. SAB-20_R2A]|uniref:YheC/YheD family endospore coat-associated protein n=1 Tax=Neobacillus sp. SAB-20_R2A TaxID=3120519 RepID=UPI003C6E6278
MITFGIMSLNLETEAPYITEMAEHAKDLGIEAFRFVPTNINPNTLQVQGKKFDAEKKDWVNAEFPIPRILYDRCFYGEDEQSKQCLPIVSWLKSRRDITFLGYGLPNKLDLYQALKDTKLSAYLPPTKQVIDTAGILKELNSGKKIVIKPINGSQGYGIYSLKKNDKSIHVKTEKQKQIISRIFPNEGKFSQWLRSLLARHQYLMQPYLELTNSELQPFDIRILLQKNEHGNWGEIGRGVRIGTSGGILSNLSAGGMATAFSEWSTSLPAARREFIQQELTSILTELPHLLERSFLPLFEIGVDIGIAKNGSIWILDMNSKPGRKVILQTRPNLKEKLYCAPLLYAKYLSESKDQERKNIYEKTLSH